MLAHEGQGDYVMGHVSLRLPDAPDLIERLPDEVSTETIVAELLFKQSVIHGLEQLERGAQSYPEELDFAYARARVLAAAPDPSVRDGRRALAIMEALSNEQQRKDGGETMAMARCSVDSDRTSSRPRAPRSCSTSCAATARSSSTSSSSTRRRT